MQVWCGNLQPPVPNTDNRLYSQVWEILCPTVIVVTCKKLGQWRQCVFISIVELRMLLNPACWWNSVHGRQICQRGETVGGCHRSNSRKQQWLQSWANEQLLPYRNTERTHASSSYAICHTPDPNCIFLEFLMRQKHWVQFKEFNWVIIMSDTH